MCNRFSVSFCNTTLQYSIKDKYGLMPQCPVFSSKDCASVYCEWLNTWIRD